MGEIRLVTDKMPDLLPMLNRSPGVHISTVISDLCVRLGHYEKSNDGPDQAMLELGNAFEYAISRRLHLDDPDRYHSLEELEKDGMFGTPDLMDVVDWIVHEIKLTWMSSNHEPDSVKFWRYWTQIKAYCWMAESTIGRLHVFHIQGNYREFGPKYRLWEQHFTQQELLENWQMLLSHGERMVEEGLIQ